MMTRRPRFFWRMHALYLVLTLGIAGAASEFAAHGIRRFYFDYAAEDLASRAVLASELMRSHLQRAGTSGELDRLCKDLGKRTSTRLTVIRPDGAVLAESSADPSHMENHAGRPEVVEALAGRVGRATRFSGTIETEYMYVAVPLREEARLVAVVRAAIPMDALATTLRQFQVRLVAAALAFGVAAYILVALFLRRIQQPLGAMRDAAAEFTRGNLKFRIDPPDYEELGSVADALNSMAGELDGRMATIRRQRDEIESILSSMREAVIAVDREEHILQVNRAAVGIFNFPETIADRLLSELVRNTEFVKLVRQTLSTGAPADGDVVLRARDEDRHLQVNTAPLLASGGIAAGALVVASDVTHVRRLEMVRRDFVANVSHELKTPLTSIKGFVEALQDGALDEPEEAHRFVGIVARQVERLQDVLSDLLSLSRIEQNEERKDLRFQREPLRRVLDEAVEVCAASAAKKSMAVQIDCPADAEARMNAALLEQAAVNLIDNAIKYSGSGSSLDVKAERAGNGWAIHFTDHGPGIEAQHLSRIFERFYRVDKARSRTEGGTGLGLSIVKHIMQAHGGSVTVTSQPGNGSTFTLHLPDADANGSNQTASSSTTTG